MLEVVTNDNIQLSFDDLKNKLSELVAKRDYLNPNSEIFNILFGSTELNKAQLKAYCLEIIKNKSELANFKSIYKAAETEHKQAQIALNKDYTPPYINDNGGVNEGLFTEYCKQQFIYKIVKSTGLDNEILYMYDSQKGYYKAISKNEMKGKIFELLPENLRSSYIAEAVYKNLLSSTDDNVIVSFNSFNTDENIINLRNGIYNIISGELKPHTPKILSSLQLNCNYDVNAKCPVFIKYIEDLQTKSDGSIDYDGIKAIQEYIGICISNEFVANRLKKSLWLYSIEGNTGKTRLIDIISALLGENNVAVMDIQKLSNNNFASYQLYGKRAMVKGDQSAADIEDSSVFKSITGGDKIFAEKKGKQGFDFRFRGGIIIGCNGLPYFKDDKGNHLFHRLVIIPCTNVITDNKKDTDLPNKLRNELDGIFLWALEGLKRLKANNWTMTQSKYMIEVLKEYRAGCDTVYAFVDENFDITKDFSNDRIKVADFYTQYSLWCANNDRQRVDKKNISKRMEGYGIIKAQYHGIYHFKGIKPKIFTDEGTVSQQEIDDIFGKSC